LKIRSLTNTRVVHLAATVCLLILAACAKPEDSSASLNQGFIGNNKMITALVDEINDPASPVYDEAANRAYLNDLLNDPQDPETAADTREILTNYFNEVKAITGPETSGVRAAAGAVPSTGMVPGCMKAGPGDGPKACPKVCAWGAGFGAAFACMTVKAKACVKCGRRKKCETVSKSGCVYAFAWAFAYACSGGGLAAVLDPGDNHCPAVGATADPLEALLVTPPENQVQSVE